MGKDARSTFAATYAWASDWRELPWAHESPTLFLAEICARRAPGRALDLGCGAGTDSLFLASRGWSVTALDFMPQALAYTRERARDAGLGLHTIEADITTWAPEGQWDLVLDHGLLHNLDPAVHQAWRERVLAALAPDGDFVLLHWHPLYPGQPDGRMGPRRVDRASIRAFLAPELVETWFALEEFEDLPDMVGGGMAQACYWFRRSPAWQDPAGLVTALSATLECAGIDWHSGRPTADPALLARIAGPGRLGLAPRTPSPEAASASVLDWARHHGLDGRVLLAMLAAHADQASGGCCTANPRCGDCGITQCKRQRQR
ncbi:MAG: class I SAM-dependent methyltransferase [Chromatiales bacterium]|nr:class I SAM-dependent methyltransferase [Chromatiales bacterium]